MSHQVHCPACRVLMVALPSTFHANKRLYYRCPMSCDYMIGAHPDGTPLGIPANGPTRAARRRAHAAFDRLWKGKKMRRKAAYTLLRSWLGLSHAEGHIARFDIETCERLIRHVEQHLGERPAEEEPWAWRS